MKIVIMKAFLISILLIWGYGTCAQPAYKILNDYIKMNNDGSESEITEFIKTYYHPDVLEQIDLDKHVKFYQHIQSDFTKLDEKIYEVVEDSDHKLLVYLRRYDIKVISAEIDPADILEVEIDLSSKNKKYLARGLGLGALICRLKEERN